MPKKKTPKGDKKTTFNYISETYCPRVLVFKRLNDTYGEHPQAKPDQYVIEDKLDDPNSLWTYKGSCYVDAQGWLFERVHIDDPAEPE